MCTLSVVAGSNNNITEFETHAHASNAGSTGHEHDAIQRDGGDSPWRRAQMSNVSVAPPNRLLCSVAVITYDITLFGVCVFFERTKPTPNSRLWPICYGVVDEPPQLTVLVTWRIMDDRPQTTKNSAQCGANEVTESFHINTTIKLQWNKSHVPGEGHRRFMWLCSLSIEIWIRKSRHTFEGAHTLLAIYQFGQIELVFRFAGRHHLACANTLSPKRWRTPNNIRPKISQQRQTAAQHTKPKHTTPSNCERIVSPSE